MSRFAPESALPLAASIPLRSLSRLFDASLTFPEMGAGGGSLLALYFTALLLPRDFAEPPPALLLHGCPTAAVTTARALLTLVLGEASAVETPSIELSTLERLLLSRPVVGVAEAQALGPTFVPLLRALAAGARSSRLTEPLVHDGAPGTLIATSPCFVASDWAGAKVLPLRVELRAGSGAQLVPLAANMRAQVWSDAIEVLRRARTASVVRGAPVDFAGLLHLLGGTVQRESEIAKALRSTTTSSEY